MLIRMAVAGAKNLLESKGGLWDRRGGIFVPKHKNVIFVRRRLLRSGNIEKFVFLGHNIVTNAGDIWYAQGAVGESQTNNFNTMYLSTVAFSPGAAKTTDAGDLASTISGSNKAEASTYPKTNDGDSDNTGAGTDVVTHLFSYTTGDFNDSDVEGITIATSSTTFGSGSDPLLMAYDETTPFAKTSSDTLKVFVNHTQNGV